MSDVKFIDTPEGDQLVILTLEDYEGLLAAAKADIDDAADIATANQRMADWEAAGRSAFPLDVVRLMRRGDSVLRAFRKFRRLTQQQLAQKTGIAQGFLSELESGQKSTSTETLVAIAKALDVAPACLLPAA